LSGTPEGRGKVDMNPVENTLRNSPQIKRLLDNPNWKSAAEAAIAYFCRGAPCTNPKWLETSTWNQVRDVYKQLASRP
jgi:hypothetical protein